MCLAQAKPTREDRGSRQHCSVAQSLARKRPSVTLHGWALKVLRFALLWSKKLWMNPASVSLINALLLIGLGLWGYFASNSPSPTAFIPVVAGVLLVVCNPGLRKQNKVIAHVAVVVTLIILLGLVMPFKGALGRGDMAAVARVGLMLVSSLVALVAFVQSFRAARAAKKA